MPRGMWRARARSSCPGRSRPPRNLLRASIGHQCQQPVAPCTQSSNRESRLLWDLRSASCVRRFAAHKATHHPVGASLSPCLRYVACGSEDRSAYLYDARSGALLERLKGPSDVVSDAAFSPMHPQLVVGGLDGRLRFYSDRPED